MQGELLFLGSGGSTGIPMVACSCSVCRSTDPRNQRLRPSVLLKIDGKTILIDVGPDFRTQALRYQISHLDGVILTHSHFDHVAGLDELRVYYLKHRKNLPLLASKATMQDLQRRYDYLFHKKSPQVSLTAQLDYQQLDGLRGQAKFCGISLSYFTYEQGGMQVNGYRFGDFAYVSDIRNYPETIFEDLQGVKTLVISALRPDPSLMHLTFDEAAAIAARLQVERCYLTHLSHEVEHERASALLPEGVELSYDGLILEDLHC